ncbi:hypothetical protein LJB89_02520, partial [Tyzzerella sp. OttesenSCG-928-J15]|nr:hypothetical protein [Tyzzerella sp. OttesenSCG-928-J15]
MEWNRAKDIIIVFLVLLNIMLGSLLGINSQKYKLSIEQEKNIVEVLASNNIGLYCKIINKYEPMKMLELTPSEFDELKMIEAFLGNSNAILSLESEGIKRYDDYSGNSVMFIENKVSFESNERDENFIFNTDNAKKICTEYLNKMGDMGKGFELDLGPYNRGEEILLEYRQSINDIVIYDNYFLFAIDEYGLRRVEYSNSLPVGYSANAKEICSSDEALFSFLAAMKRESSDKPQRIVEKMDLVYFIDPLEQESNQAYPY